MEPLDFDEYIMYEMDLVESRESFIHCYVTSRLAWHAEKTIICTEGPHAGKEMTTRPISKSALCDILEYAAPRMSGGIEPCFGNLEWASMEEFVLWITGYAVIEKELLNAICVALSRGMSTPHYLITSLKHTVPRCSAFRYPFLDTWSIQDVTVDEAIFRLCLKSHNLYLCTMSAYLYDSPRHVFGNHALIVIADPSEKEVILIRVHKVSPELFESLTEALAHYSGSIYSYKSAFIPNLKTITMQKDGICLIAAANARGIPLTSHELLSNWSRKNLRKDLRLYAAGEAVALSMLNEDFSSTP